MSSGEPGERLEPEPDVKFAAVPLDAQWDLYTDRNYGCENCLMLIDKTYELRETYNNLRQKSNGIEVRLPTNLAHSLRHRFFVYMWYALSDYLHEESEFEDRILTGAPMCQLCGCSDAMYDMAHRATSYEHYRSQCLDGFIKSHANEIAELNRCGEAHSCLSQKISTERPHLFFEEEAAGHNWYWCNDMKHHMQMIRPRVLEPALIIPWIDCKGFSDPFHRGRKTDREKRGRTSKSLTVCKVPAKSCPSSPQSDRITDKKGRNALNEFGLR
eukprot:Platyproteum_vivax@DN15196_c0_g1_i1.p1